MKTPTRQATPSIAALALMLATARCASGGSDPASTEFAGASGASGTAGQGGAGQGAGQGGAGQGGAGASGAAGEAGAGGQVELPCEGITCNQPTCDPATPTAVEGRVYDPAGQAGLYNVLVYVPSAELEPLTDGLSCDRCGTVPSGKPVAAALTDESGHFRIENVPAGDNIPLVIQTGKWRRTLVLPSVKACATTPTTDGTLTLPRNRTEGDMPRIAVVTGGFDQLGCLLRRMGVDDAEFTDSDGPGRVHVYRGFTGGGVAGGEAKEAKELWGSFASLSRYDVLLLACEGNEYDEQDPTGTNKTIDAKKAMHGYASQGGRIFATHYHYTWFKNSPNDDFKGVATWLDPASAYGKETLTVEASDDFPKGQAFSKWLVNVGASPPPGGTLDVENPARNIASVNPPTQRWLYQKDDGQVRYMSFNTPVNRPIGEQCGRAVVTDIHVREELGATELPTVCDASKMTPQERALEFLFFDLGSCLQPDDARPTPPDIK